MHGRKKLHGSALAGHRWRLTVRFIARGRAKASLNLSVADGSGARDVETGHFPPSLRDQSRTKLSVTAPHAPQPSRSSFGTFGHRSSGFPAPSQSPSLRKGQLLRCPSDVKIGLLYCCYMDGISPIIPRICLPNRLEVLHSNSKRERQISRPTAVRVAVQLRPLRMMIKGRLGEPALPCAQPCVAGFSAELPYQGARQAFARRRPGGPVRARAPAEPAAARARWRAGPSAPPIQCAGPPRCPRPRPA